MKRVVSIGVALMMTIAMMAAPAYRGWRTVTTSEGETITVRQMGDEFYHYWESSDGRIVRHLTDGTFLVTDKAVPTAKQIAARRAASPMQKDNARKVGTVNLAPRGLVILAAFADVPFQAENTQAAFDSLMNVEGYDYSYYNSYYQMTFSATGSAADYFKAQSDGKYQPVFDVVGPVTLPNNRAYYGSNTSDKEGSDANTRQMVVDACKLADSQVDFTLYDNDKNGIVDFVYVIYAGMGEADGGPEESVWPVSWHTGGSYYVDGKRLSNFACSGEINGLTEGRSGIGTICHEFGHVIGLPDYYDTNYSTNYTKGLTPNDWSIMDQGCYNNNGITPPNYSIFDKYFMGWATPKHLAKDAKRNVRLSTRYDDAYQITGGTTLKNYNTTDTVYYIENRQHKGWDKYLPGNGMLVWQVVYNQSAWSGNTPNNTTDKPRYTLIAADGSKMLGDKWDSSWENLLHEGKSDPFPGTANIRSYTPFAGCALTNIQEQAGVITFLFNGGKTICEYLVMAEHCVVSDEVGEVAIGQPLEITITPETGYTLDADCWLVEMGEGSDLLTYGVDYTYNTTTGLFRIEKVEDDVTILVEAKAETATGMERNQPSAISIQKVLRNGQVLIVRGDEVYTVTGVRVEK